MRERGRIHVVSELVHVGPVREGDERELVGLDAVCRDGGDRVPLALPLEPGDSGRKPLARRVERRQAAASSSGTSPLRLLAARRGSSTRLSR
jgi:hypothetical protein